MTREDRDAEIEDYIGYLDALHAGIMGQVAGEPRVVVLGFSQGVATACRWLARGRARAHLLVLWAGPLPVELDAASAAPLRRARIVRVLGDADDLADPGAVAAEDARIDRMGIEAEMIRFPGGHEIDAGVLARLAG
jgi:predicted esterase